MGQSGQGLQCFYSIGIFGHIIGVQSQSVSILRTAVVIVALGVPIFRFFMVFISI